MPNGRQPWVGDVHVDFLESNTGARVLVYDRSFTGIGGSAGNQIALNRAMSPDDNLTVVQMVGACTSNNGYRVAAMCTNLEQECE